MKKITLPNLSKVSQSPVSQTSTINTIPGFRIQQRKFSSNVLEKSHLINGKLTWTIFIAPLATKLKGDIACEELFKFYTSTTSSEVTAQKELIIYLVADNKLDVSYATKLIDNLKTINNAKNKS